MGDFKRNSVQSDNAAQSLRNAAVHHRETAKQTIINHILNQWTRNRGGRGGDWQVTVQVNGFDYLGNQGRPVRVIEKFDLDPTMVKDFKASAAEIQFKLDEKLFEMSDLMKAVLKGSVAEVHQLLRQGVDVNFKNILGVSAIQVLFQPEIFLRSSISHGFQASLLARENKADVDIARLLIDAGANLQVKGFHGESLLEMAMWNKKKEIAKMLVRSGAPIHGRPAQNSSDFAPRTPLQLACFKGYNDSQLVKELLAQGANTGNSTALIGVVLSEFPSAIEEAIKAENAASVQLLLNAGASIRIGILPPHVCHPDVCSPICVRSVLYNGGASERDLTSSGDLATSLTFYNGTSLTDCCRRAIYHQLLKVTTRVQYGASPAHNGCHDPRYHDAVSSLPLPDLMKQTLINQYGLDYCLEELVERWECPQLFNYAAHPMNIRIHGIDPLSIPMVLPVPTNPLQDPLQGLLNTWSAMQVPTSSSLVQSPAGQAQSNNSAQPPAVGHGGAMGTQAGALPPNSVALSRRAGLNQQQGRGIPVQAPRWQTQHSVQSLGFPW